MEDYKNLINESTTLSGLFGSKDFSDVKDVTENIDDVMSQGSHFDGMSDVSPEMIEMFMRGKVDHINAVNAKAEEISAKKREELINRYRKTFSEEYAENNENHETERKTLVSDPKLHDMSIMQHLVDDGCYCPKNNVKIESGRDTEKELTEIKGELNEIKEMMRKMMENSQKPVQPDVKFE